MARRLMAQLTRPLVLAALVGAGSAVPVTARGGADRTGESLVPTMRVDGQRAAPAQVVINPAVAGPAIGPARNWEHVAPGQQYYYGPNYRYDAGWYAQRHLGYPNSYVAYNTDPANVCNTEYYYMPDDGLYYCYTPDPVALNSALQGRCPNQPYLYICP